MNHLTEVNLIICSVSKGAAFGPRHQSDPQCSSLQKANIFVPISVDTVALLLSLLPLVVFRALSFPFMHALKCYVP